MANCPHCEAPVGALTLSSVKGYAANGTTWNCLVFSCRTCGKAISADVDMTAVRSDIITAIEMKK